MLQMLGFPREPDRKVISLVHFSAVAQLGAFDAVVKQMLEDVQERLVYRTHIYIQTDITGYKPAPGDLAYPEKLEMMEVSFTRHDEGLSSDVVYVKSLGHKISQTGKHMLNTSQCVAFCVYFLSVMKFFFVFFFSKPVVQRHFKKN